MSTIIDAIRKAEKEEQIKNEQGVEKVVWMTPEKKTISVPSFIHSRGLLSTVLIVLVLISVWSVKRWLDEPVAVQAPVAAVSEKEEAVQTGPAPVAAKAVTALPLPKNLKLSGIMWDEREPLALINSLAVKKGDSVKGSLVIAIHPDSVELASEGKIWTLTLGDQQ